MSGTLETLDWIIIVGYLGFAVVVGVIVSRRASAGIDSYFVAGRSLPWWWAGSSIAATMFAADTPLVVTGIVARDGLSGNWFWLSWGVLHVAVLCFFADRWRKSEVLTDAELVTLRYPGRTASWLRSFRAGLYGLVVNAIILGWVLRAMTKIVAPYVHWESWTPWLTSAIAVVLPEGGALGTPSEAITVLMLVGIVGFYSSLGGIRGVILTDLVQLVMALCGSFALAWIAADRVGGIAELGRRVTELSPGTDVTSMAPTAVVDIGVASIAAVATALYLFAQSVSNNPADGGGFFMQRLAACKSPTDARRATGWFIVLNYVIRPWPWFVVALAALVLIPVGGEHTVFGGQVAYVAGDREAGYAALISVLLPAGLEGLLIVSLLAAFMSTVDTHINWGASYLVNDFYLRARPDADAKTALRFSRFAVVGLTAVAVISALCIGSIEGAWQTLATIGAGIAAPTALRWLWWRVTAVAEIAATAAGLATWAILALIAPALSYELSLCAIFLAGAATTVLVSLLGPAADRAAVERFVARVEPLGWWPGQGRDRAPLLPRLSAFALLCVALYAVILGGAAWLFGDGPLPALWLGAGLVLAAIGWRILERAASRDLGRTS